MAKFVFGMVQSLDGSYRPARENRRFQDTTTGVDGGSGAGRSGRNLVAHFSDQIRGVAGMNSMELRCTRSMRFLGRRQHVHFDEVKRL